MNLFKRNSNKIQFGLVNYLNKRGLGTETRILKDVADRYFSDVDMHIYKLPTGRAAYEFDNNWHSIRKFTKWIKSKHIIMTIELFMPNLFRVCQEHGIKTIWRPNHEWIDPKYGKEDFEMIDVIMAPQKACADFLEQKYALQNIVRNPWICNLPVHKKKVNQTHTTFLFNAGRGGTGNRRNAELVIQAFSKVLAQRKDFLFTLKTQLKLDISPLQAHFNKSFSYIHKNTSYAKNLKFYETADFSIAPSKWEGVGFAILESLYCGTPVITTDAPPMNEWISHKETGYLVPITFPDIALPIKRGSDKRQGMNWIKAAQCDVEDLADGIVWLADNKQALYENFNRINEIILNTRKRHFIDTFNQTIARMYHQR